MKVYLLELLEEQYFVYGYVYGVYSDYSTAKEIGESIIATDEDFKRYRINEYVLETGDKYE